MKTKVCKLPKHATYDYTESGIKHYHTKRRCYEVINKIDFGKKKVIIYSMKNDI